MTNLLDFDRLPTGHLHAVETYNQNAAVAWPDQAEGRYAADALLARGDRLHVTAGDDAHWHHRWDRFAAWVHVRADRLDPGALLDALKAGAYYSSQGPRIDDVRVDGSCVEVACSAARSIALTGIHGWRSDVATGERLERATLDLDRLRSPYWRLTVTDAQGKRAWTNPVWPTRPAVRGLDARAGPPVRSGARVGRPTSGRGRAGAGHRAAAGSLLPDHRKETLP